MARRVWQWLGTDAGVQVVLGIAALVTVLSTWALGEEESGLPEITEGSLVYRSPVSGRYGVVPLQRTDVAIDVRGLVAATTVTQRYANLTGEALEAVYVFPLPHDAAVYDMEVRIGGRVIRSVVREREQAKKTYETAKAEGKRAALVEQERPNVFTASVANILPGDRIDVRIRYVEPLKWEDGRVRLVFPMVVGPRYIAGQPAADAAGAPSGTGWAPDTGAVPDASRITPPVRHPASRSRHDIVLRVSLDAGAALDEVTSPTHPLRITRNGDGTQLVQLADQATLPNRDFVLEFRRAESLETRSALFLSPHPSGGETHFMLVAFPPSVQPEGDRPPLEMLFLIDISGSMAGTSIQQAREALLQGLDRLRPDDRFEIVAFDDQFFGFAPAPVPATADNLEAGRRFVRGLQARGGTEMLPALEHLMAMPREPGFLRYVLVLTDGDLGNEEQVLASVRRSLGDARLFTVAIGSAPNHFLASKMAELGRGSFSSIADAGEIRERMGRLLDTIESPVLSDVTLSFDGATVADLYPSRPPDLFLRQPLLILGRLRDGARGSLRVSGAARGTRYEQDIPFDAGSASFHPGITTLWARLRIEEELDLWRRSRDDEERERRRAAIVQDAVHYNLVTRFTSLVAVEDVVVNAGDAPRTAVVPTELPHGWRMDEVFGGNPKTGTADSFLEALGVVLLAAGLLLRVVRSEEKRLAARLEGKRS